MAFSLFFKRWQRTIKGKSYLNEVRQGIVPCTFLEHNEAYDDPFVLGSQSWNYKESGTTASARNCLSGILGRAQGFSTPKPIELIEKIIQLWCPPEGIVLDAFAGSGTTAHAVLDLNHQTEANRSFILIECGQGDDKFCDTLTAERVRRVITGKWADNKEHEKIDSGFTYLRAGRRLGKDAIMQAQREELADIILQSSRETSGLIDCRVEEPGLQFIIGKTKKGEGIALVWGEHGNIFERKFAKTIRNEANKLGLKTPLQIYATVNKGPNGADWYNFCRIPDSILSALGIPNKPTRKSHESD